MAIDIGILFVLVRTSMIDQRYSPRVCFLNVLSPTTGQKRHLFTKISSTTKGILTYYYVFSVNFLERKKERKRAEGIFNPFVQLCIFTTKRNDQRLLFNDDDDGDICHTNHGAAQFFFLDSQSACVR